MEITCVAEPLLHTPCYEEVKNHAARGGAVLEFVMGFKLLEAKLLEGAHQKFRIKICLQRLPSKLTNKYSPFYITSNKMT